MTIDHLSPATRAALEALLAAEAPLDRLSALRAMSAALEGEPALLVAVREALDAGESWAAIAASARLGEAAAKWRWQGSDDDIAARHEAGRRRSARPSSKPTDLPGLSVSQAAARLGITPQGVYQRINRGQLETRTVTLEDGRSYKRVML